MQSSILMARALLEERAARENLLASLSSLAEPCWLILLRLFCADSPQKRSAICIAKLLHVGLPTAERYLRLLEEQGLIRISLIEADISAVLQPSTMRAMDQILEEMLQQSRRVLNC